MKFKNKRFGQKFLDAFRGLYFAFKSEKSIRTEFFAFALVIAFCTLSRPPAIWCAIFISMSTLVLTLELVNTALELLLDKLYPNKDDTVGLIKDCLAGAVLLASTFSILIFGVYLFTLI